MQQLPLSALCHIPSLVRAAAAAAAAAAGAAIDKQSIIPANSDIAAAQ
jgi:hypothetical protein